MVKIFIIAGEESGDFIGSKLIENLKLETKIVGCGRCSNNCEIVTVYKNDELLDYWGNHCEKGSILKNV